MFNPAEDLSVFQYLVSQTKIERKSAGHGGFFRRSRAQRQELLNKK